MSTFSSQSCGVRSGFSIAEVTVALAILGVMMVLVAQIGYWSLHERLENVARQLALEHANNILDAARTLPFEQLNEHWAADVVLPESKLLSAGQVGISIEPEPDLPRVKRVTVEISWARDRDLPEQLVKLVALFAARTEVNK